MLTVEGADSMRYFLLGAIGYPLLELCWRGRTHPSMALAGGLTTLLLGRLQRSRLSIVQGALLSGLAVTGLEALIGCTVNRRHRIWDYRTMPCNWRGQICLPYTLLWGALCGGTLAFMRAAHEFY